MVLPPAPAGLSASPSTRPQQGLNTLALPFAPPPPPDNGGALILAARDALTSAMQLEGEGELRGAKREARGGAPSTPPRKGGAPAEPPHSRSPKQPAKKTKASLKLSPRLRAAADAADRARAPHPLVFFNLLPPLPPCTACQDGPSNFSTDKSGVL